jgi:hypothetical protein
MNTLEIEIQEARAQDVRVDENVLAVDLADGRTIITPLAWFPRLMYGTSQERAHFEIIGDGKYIHWLDLDEDLSIAGILAGRQAKENPEILKKWLAARPKAVKQPARQVAEKKAKYGK